MTTRERLTAFADVVSFTISSFSIFAIANYYLFQEIYYLKLNMMAVLFQCSYDIFLWHTNDSVIHHIFVLLIGSFLFQNDLQIDEYLFILLPLTWTEISTLFLVMKSWLEKLDLKDSGWYLANNVLFLCTFIFSRLFIYTTYIVLNPQTYEFINSKVTTLWSTVPIYTGIFGLFALNIYWTTIMMKILSNPLKHVMRNYYTQLFLCIAPWLNIAICLYYYDFQINGHVVGTVLMSLSSFLLQHSILVFQNGDAVFYALNQLSIQVKSALFVASHLGMMFGHISLLYHFVLMTITLWLIIRPNKMYYISGKIFFSWIALPLLMIGYIIFDIISPFMSFVCFVSLLLYSYPIFSITEKETIVLPLALDVMLVISQQENLNTMISLGVVSYCILVISYVRPLYHHNLVLLYVMSIIQTVVLCQINSSTMTTTF